jgi:hypothetical protein
MCEAPQSDYAVCLLMEYFHQRDYPQNRLAAN